MQNAIKAFLAVTLLAAPAQVDAQRMVCGPNGCSYVRAPIASAVRPHATVYRAAPARTRSVRVTTYRRGLFGRRVPVTRYVPATQATSYGSSGSTAVYSSGSHGGYSSTPVVTESYGSSGGYRATPAQPQQAEPAATLPPVEDQSRSEACRCGDDCLCGPGCQCSDTAIASLPPLPVICSLPPVPVVATLPTNQPPTILLASR